MIYIFFLFSSDKSPRGALLSSVLSLPIFIGILSTHSCSSFSSPLAIGFRCRCDTNFINLFWLLIFCFILFFIYFYSLFFPLTSPLRGLAKFFSGSGSSPKYFVTPRSRLLDRGRVFIPPLGGRPLGLLCPYGSLGWYPGFSFPHPSTRFPLCIFPRWYFYFCFYFFNFSF